METARPAWRTGRQSVPRMAHPNQQALRLQFPTEPKFPRLNHEPCSFPIDWDGDSIVWLVRRRGARRGGLRPTRQPIVPKPTVLEMQISCAIENAKGREPAQRLSGGSSAGHRQEGV